MLAMVVMVMINGEIVVSCQFSENIRVKKNKIECFFIRHQIESGGSRNRMTLQVTCPLV